MLIMLMFNTSSELILYGIPENFNKFSHSHFQYYTVNFQLSLQMKYRSPVI